MPTRRRKALRRHGARSERLPRAGASDEPEARGVSDSERRGLGREEAAGVPTTSGTPTRRRKALRRKAGEDSEPVHHAVRSVSGMTAMPCFYEVQSAEIDASFTKKDIPYDILLSTLNLRKSITNEPYFLPIHQSYLHIFQKIYMQIICITACFSAYKMLKSYAVKLARASRYIKA